VSVRAVLHQLGKGDESDRGSRTPARHERHSLDSVTVAQFSMAKQKGTKNGGEKCTTLEVMTLVTPSVKEGLAVITREVVMDIKAMNRNGLSIRRIAKITGLHRKTVRSSKLHNFLRCYM
jgi:DNA invertase Pin-like site-specific DNA recombinase